MVPKAAMLQSLKIDEKPNTQFWVTQLIILVSTILGVYLASFAGYSIAVDFDRYQRVTNQLNLEKALLAEVSDNVGKVDVWTSGYSKAPMAWHDKRLAPDATHRLDNMIWLTMRNSPQTFEINQEAITKVRRFYSAVETQKLILLQQRNSNGYAKQAMGTLTTLAEGARADILPLLNSSIEKLEKKHSSMR